MSSPHDTSCATRSSATERTTPQRSRKSGSILVIVVILGTGIALSLGSFIILTVRALNLSNRSFHANSALNLAEAGVEEALYALNHSDWSGWATHTSGTSNKYKTLGPFDLGQGATGVTTVIVYGATTAPLPYVVAEGRATPTSGPQIFKQIKVKLRRRSHWATGLVAKDSITFSGGNATVDSYVSSDPTYSTGGLYDASKKRDHGSAGSTSVTTDAVSISNSDIWGYVATGGAPPESGPNGTIKGEDTPPGVKRDPNRITTDFTANFDVETTPTTYDVLIANISGNATLGTSGSATTIKTASVSNTNGKTVDIYGDVTLIVTNSIDIKGSLIVHNNASLTVYVQGDVDVGGNGALNETGLPENMVFYGTGTTVGSQTIKMHGNGAMHAAIYAPNASLEMKGGGSSGEFSGSAVANDIKITGNYAFHYDEALEDVSSGNPFAVAKWLELIKPSDQVSL